MSLDSMGTQRIAEILTLNFMILNYLSFKAIDYKVGLSFKALN